jgi:hypothetical protein
MDPIHENIKQQRELAAEIIACVEAGPDLAQSRGTMSTYSTRRRACWPSSSGGSSGGSSDSVPS